MADNGGQRSRTTAPQNMSGSHLHAEHALADRDRKQRGFPSFSKTIKREDSAKFGIDLAPECFRSTIPLIVISTV